MTINKYRDLCRRRIRECDHPLITSARKLVLLRVVDYINSDDLTAWPAFDRLADDLDLDRSTVIRANQLRLSRFSTCETKLMA